MTWNRPYIGTQSKHTTVLSDLSISGTLDVGPIDTGALAATTIAGTTGNFTSTMSVRGATTLHAQLDSASALSAGALKGTTVKLNAQPVMTLVSASSTTIVATTVAATMSTTTNLTNNSVAAGDLVIVGPSSLSNGVVLQAIASGASTIQFVYSNCSAAAASQVAINCRYQVWRF